MICEYLIENEFVPRIRLSERLKLYRKLMRTSFKISFRIPFFFSTNTHDQFGSVVFFKAFVVQLKLTVLFYL